MKTNFKLIYLSKNAKYFEKKLKSGIMCNLKTIILFSYRVRESRVKLGILLGASL